MILSNLQAIVLAAGKSTRLKNGKTKLCEKICGQELILYPINMLHDLHIPITLVVGYKQDQVRQTIALHQKLELIQFVEQTEPQGTGEALACTQSVWDKDHILIMNGDLPFVTPDIITQLYKKHFKTNAAISYIAAHMHRPSNTSYEYVIKTENAAHPVLDIHAPKDTMCCINAGIYIARKEFLLDHLSLLKPDGHQETHVFDLINLAYTQHLTVTMHKTPFDSVRGINTYQELWEAEQIKRAQLIKYWMDRGVQFAAAQNVHIDNEVTIGTGTFIGCGVHLLGATTIGSNCIINAFSLVESAHIADNVTIDFHSIVRNARIGTQAHIGPFAHIHHNSVIGSETIIGNFVELKDSTIGNNTKAKHLNYLGNAQIGNNVNIGAGTITCNHNGVTKEQTTIHDNAYVGSNNSLVAPVTIEQYAFTAAGSVITENVPEHALAIARSRQINKEGYAKKLRSKKEKSIFKGAQKVVTSESAC